MLRTPDLPESEKREFDKEEYKEIKKWLKRKEEGKIKSSQTSGGWVLVVWTAFILAIIIGGTIGALLAIYRPSFILLLAPFLIVFGVLLYFLNNNYAEIEIDPENEMILYDGAVSFGGELRTIRYRGTIKVIEAVQVVRFKRFLRKSKPFIRFITRSGYLRVNYNPEEEEDFLKALEQVGLIEPDTLEDALKNENIIKDRDKYVVYYSKEFDRSEYFARIKREREQEKLQEKIRKKRQKEELLEKQKKMKNHDTEQDDKN